MKTAAEKAIAPFRIIEDLGVPCGYERSFKMLQRQLLANRFLLGINTKDTTHDKLLDVCRRLDMPEAYIESFGAQLEHANVVFLGFEDNEPGCIYKVYLEFWESTIRRLQGKPNKKPALLHLGFKWRADDNSQGTTSKYTWYPLLSVENILMRLSDIYEGYEDRTSVEVAEDIIKFAARRTDAGSLVYLEVSEQNNPRTSFDINLYQAACRLREIHPFLSRMREHYSIPADRFGRLYKLVANQLLGHLSGGINRDGKDFLTVYYEM